MIKTCDLDGKPCHTDCDQWSDCRLLDDDLIAICAAQAKRIKELEEGACRYNCRRAKDAFMAGYDYGLDDYSSGNSPTNGELLRRFTKWREGK